MSRSANVRIGKCLDRQMSANANAWISGSANVRISKYPDRQMSGWQMSGPANDHRQSANVWSPNVMVSFCPFGKCGSANVNRQKSAPIKSKWILKEVHAILLCMVLRYYSVLLPYSFSVCEQAEKLEILDHAFSVTSMTASIGQWLC